METNLIINEFINYGIKNSLIEKIDGIYVANRLIDILKVDSFKELNDVNFENRTIDEILDDLLKVAISNKVINDNVLERDLLDTKIMNLITPMPREVNKKFNDISKLSGAAATDYLYNLSISTNYVRYHRSQKDLEWVSKSKYGKLILSINLSKPEIDPSDMQYFKNLEKGKVKYPKCMLCKENIGYSGSVVSNQNTNMRTANIKLNGEDFYIVFSPYSYYNEHCHIVSMEHTPMEINRKTFERLIDFVDQFPNYFIGSNADLPIVGSSVLSHEHYKGGEFDFPIYNALPKVTKTFGNVKFELLNWPLTTFRLTSKNKEQIIDFSNKILVNWQEYTNKTINVIGYGNVLHNTITPIVRKVKNEYVVYIALRNNDSDELHPYGFFHPEANLHHIKKENIGVIEVMGMAILPGRLFKELSILRSILNGELDESHLEEIKIHKNWYYSLKGRSYTEEDLQNEVSKKFERILESCNVFKYASIEDVIDFMDSIE